MTQILKFRDERFQRCPECGRPTALLNNGRLRRHFVVDESGRHLCVERAIDRKALRVTG